MTAPSTPQHMQALASGNTKRLGVAAFKRDVRALEAAEGALKVAHAIEHDHDDEIIGSARVGPLLRAIRSLGRDKASKCLTAAGVRTDERRVRELTERQIGAIVIQLEFWAERHPFRKREAAQEES